MRNSIQIGHEAKAQQGFRRFDMHGRLLSVAILFCAVLLSLARADDALSEAQRQTITALVHSGKYDQAAALCKELLSNDPTHYQDHLTLARIDEKLGDRAGAIGEFDTVLDVLPPTPRDEGERSAQAEATRRMHVLDPSAEKLQIALVKFDEELEALQRTCREARDSLGYNRIEGMRKQLAALMPSPTHELVQVPARVDHIVSKMKLVAGCKYQVVAVGSWSDGAGTSYDASGVPQVISGNFDKGALIAAVDDGPIFLIGEKKEFTPSVSGPLKLALNGIDKEGNSGAIKVYIGKVDIGEAK